MSVDDGVRRLHDHLKATEEQPVAPAAGRLLGEAAAVAADLVDADLPEPVVAERVRQVAKLLDEVDTTGNGTVDDHVAAAKRATEDVRSSVDGD